MLTSASRTIVVLDPTSPPRQARHALASRLPGLHGRSVGFLWNSKPNGDLLFQRLEELLRERHAIAQALHRRKPSMSVPAARELLDEMAASVNAAVVGIGD